MPTPADLTARLAAKQADAHADARRHSRNMTFAALGAVGGIAAVVLLFSAVAIVWIGAGPVAGSAAAIVLAAGVARVAWWLR